MEALQRDLGVRARGDEATRGAQPAGERAAHDGGEHDEGEDGEEGAIRARDRHGRIVDGGGRRVVRPGE
jgi:hypothetical protein